MSPHGTGPVPRCPLGCWAGSFCSCYICREVGGTVGPPCAGVQELQFQHVLFEDPHWGLPQLPPQDPSLPSQQSDGDRGAQRSCRQGVTWQLCLPVGAPWS